MADVAKIFRINYKSDFILTLTSDAGWMTPFCIKFWTGAPSQAYYVSWNGETYNHCSFDPSDPTKLLVQFDDHHLPIGNLKFQVAYHFTVADFPNDTEDEVINPANITTEIDGETYQVMLDFTGETAPEIQFALPAYANEAQRIDNEQQRIAAETQRIANEETRIQHEESRIAAEQTRQQNEQQRINQEQARVNEYASLKADAVAATGAANDAAALAYQKAQLAADKAALAQAAADLANAKALLAADKAALAATAAQLANDKAALAQQKAEYAQTQGGYAKDQGDYAKDKGDICSADHLVAVADHGIAVDDHTQAGNDHTRAESDHGIAVDDHTQAGNDHTRAESDHGIAADDHTQAGTDHQTAAADHQTATADHTKAGNDHTRAESDHTRAESDHAAVEVYVDSLGAFDISAYHATGGVLAKYADLTAALGTNGANVPDALRKGGMSVKFVQSSDNKYVQARCMAQNFTTDITQWQGVDDEPTAGSDNLVKSGGIYVNQEKLRRDINGLVIGEGTGVVSSAGTWNMTEGNTHKYFHVFPGDIITITANSTYGAQYSCFKTYPTSFSQSFPARNLITKETTVNITIPDDTTVIVVANTYMSGTMLQTLYPSEILINGNKIEGLNARVGALEERTSILSDGVDNIPTKDSTKLVKSGGIYKSFDVNIPVSSDVIEDYHISNGIIIAEPREGEQEGDIRSSGSWKLYLIENKGYNIVNAKTGCTAGGGVYAIAFYSSSTPSHSSFISGVNMKDGIADHTGTIPSNCTHIAICTRTANLSQPVVSFDIIDNEHLLKYISLNTPQPPASVEKTITYGFGDAYKLIQAYWGKTGDTLNNSYTASGSWHLYMFDNEKLKVEHISANLCGNASSNAGIILFNSKVLSAANVIDYKLLSSSPSNLSIDVPSTCKAIVISTRYTGLSVYSTLEMTRTVSFDDDDVVEPNSIITKSKDKDYIIEGSSSFCGKKVDKVKNQYLTAVHFTDIHGESVNYKRMIDFVNQHSDAIDVIFDTGDQVAFNFSDSGFEAMYVDHYQDTECKNLFVIGNHEVGDDSGNKYNIYSYGNLTNTIAGIVARYITPYMTYNGCVQGTDAGYYYKDFSDYKIRVIGLFEYEIPRIVDPNNNTAYLYDYWARYISQNQADWLVSTLNSVQNGWGVVILMHQCVDLITEYTDNKFNSNGLIHLNVAQGPIIQDIIDAYISKTTLTKTYSNTIGAPASDVPDVSVNADFSSANGEFISYVCGHTHCDKIGQSSVATNKQLVVCLTTGGTIKSGYDDIYRLYGKKSQDAFNMIVFDTDKKKVRLLRIGADSTLNMEYRDMVSVSYT